VKVVSYVYNALSSCARRYMRKFLVQWGFGLALAYIFFEAQRLLMGVVLSSAEWVGIAILGGVAYYLWGVGVNMDKAEEDKRLAKLTMAIREVFIEAGLIKKRG